MAAVSGPMAASNSLAVNPSSFPASASLLPVIV